MKQTTLILASFLTLASCAPTSMITGSWKNPATSSRSYKTIFVAALTGNTIAKSTTENDLAAALSKYGVQSLKSVDEFPPNFLKDSIPKRELLDKVKKKNVDGILTVSLLKKTSESRYTPGSYSYAPVTRFGYYGTFGGYYNYWSPYAYNPGYYTEEDIYYLETNLYDTGTEALIWSAQSKTYSYGNLASVSKELSALLAEKMKSDGVFN